MERDKIFLGSRLPDKIIQFKKRLLFKSVIVIIVLSSEAENSVKRSDVTRWKQGYITPPLPYFIVLDSSVKTKEVKIIEFHRITLGIPA